MYIVKVLVEHAIYKLDTTYDYLSKYQVLAGCRVHIRFGYQQLVGYVVECQETLFTQKQLEEKNGFKYSFIQDVIDQKPLLNQELQELANYLSKQTLSTRISCLQCMLPPQLKPSTNHSVGIKYQKVVSFVKDIPLKTTKQQEALNYIKEHDLLPIKDYPFSTALLNNIEKQGAIIYKQVEVYRNPYNEHLQQEDYPLTTSQQKVVNQILASFHQFKTFLLYGVTGSGKTEVYLQLIEKVLNEGKTSLMLVPEIALTPQTVDRFIARFGEDNIAVLHSKLSMGERYDQWNKIKKDEAKIVIGARSAIFAPIQNLGLIIMDEEHDQSYKSETTPKYHAREIARYLAKENSISLVLGSATPDLETFYKTQTGEIKLLELTQRANNAKLPNVEIVDLRNELEQGNKTMISGKLYKAIKENLQNNKQTILFLNRRGFSTFVMCRECGHTIKCKNCDITLTYHANSKKLKCHYCGYEEEIAKECPECHSKNIKYFGAGTQKLEEQIHLLFPEASTIRMDVDTVTKKNSHEEILNKFKKDNINILIGTQMVVKGHHFPNVTLVGVIAADTSLNIDDFKANEHTFQILTQVARKSRERKGTRKGNNSNI